MPRPSVGEYLSLTSVQKFLLGKHTAEERVTATEQYYSKAFPHNDSPNSPIFLRHSDIAVLVIYQFISTKISLCKYLSIFYPTNVLPHTVLPKYVHSI